MAKVAYLQSAALAVLAASAALVAAPAQAQDRGGWHERHADGGQGGERQGRGEARQQQAQQAPRQQAPQGNGGGWQRRMEVQQQQAPQAQARWQRRVEAPQQQAQQVDGGRWQRRMEMQQQAPQGDAGRWQQRSWRGGDQAGQWQGRVRQAPATTSRDWSQQRNWNERNSTYADPYRNRTYRQQGYAGRYYGGRDAYRDGTRWNNNWRQDRRYDWRGYRSSNRDVYRLGRYYSPYRNYSYRRLNVGIFLEPLFFGNNYWIDDPWQYRLPEVYGPYRWVRYYDDVLLVDIYSGEVVDVIYDFFW